MSKNEKENATPATIATPATLEAVLVAQNSVAVAPSATSSDSSEARIAATFEKILNGSRPMYPVGYPTKKIATKAKAKLDRKLNEALVERFTAETVESLRTKVSVRFTETAIDASRFEYIDAGIVRAPKSGDAPHYGLKCSLVTLEAAPL